MGAIALLLMPPSRTVALFLSTLALAGSTVACGQRHEEGEKGGDKDKPALTQPAEQAPASKDGKDGEEGGEGGEGGES